MTPRILLMASVRWYNATAAYAVELAQGLAERGVDTHLLVQPGSPAESEARRRGITVLAPCDLTATAPASLLANLRALRAAFREIAPDVLNAHRSEDHLLGALALRGTGIPLVRTRGDVRPPRRHLGNRALYRRATAAHIACADFMPERYYAPLGVDPERVTVIRPGFDVARFAEGAPTLLEARRILGLEPRATWVGQIGRLTRAKAPDLLIGAAARLPHPVRVLLSGDEFTGAPDGWTHEALRARAAAQGIGERVHVIGRQADVRVPLRALDLLAVPSLASEAISRIAMEALALGVPVVASRINALPEVVGDAGRLVPPGDPEALALGIRSLLEDEGALAHARAEGPARIRRRYDRAIQIDRTLEVMERARAKR